MVQHYSSLVAGLSTDSTTNRGEAKAFSFIDRILPACLELRNNLTPYLTKLLHKGIWATLKKSDSPTMAATLRDLGLLEESSEVDLKSKLTCTFSSEEQEVCLVM